MQGDGVKAGPEQRDSLSFFLTVMRAAKESLIGWRAYSRGL